MTRQPDPLETVWLDVPAHAAETYEAALAQACATTGRFLLDEPAGIWRVEGVRARGDDAALTIALLLANAAAGLEPELHRAPTEAEGWLARTQESFPQQLIARRLAIRGEHVRTPPPPARVTLTLDAGIAFGSGEHGSTRGCLRMLEHAIRRRPRPRRILDLGTGSGILAMAAARLTHRPVIASDIDPWSIRVTRRNAQRNGVARLVRPVLADGWHSPALAAAGPYDLVFANILARPLCLMARPLAAAMAPHGAVILSGLLDTQVRMVLAAHRRAGLRLVARAAEGPWTTLLCEKP